MLKELAKLGDKLDSFGLFKEASFIDKMLSKVAQSSFTPEILVKFGIASFVGMLRNTGGFFPIAYNNRETGPQINIINILKGFNDFLPLYGNDPAFLSWYQRNNRGDFEQDLAAWIAMAGAAARDYLQNNTDRNRDNKAVKDAVYALQQTVRAYYNCGFKTFIDNDPMKLNIDLGKHDYSEPVPSESYNPGFLREPTVEEPPSAPTASNAPANPWYSYSKAVGDTRMSIKATWEARAKAMGTDASFASYKKWLNATSNYGKSNMSVADVLEQLNAEIKGEGMRRDISSKTSL